MDIMVLCVRGKNNEYLLVPSAHLQWDIALTVPLEHNTHNLSSPSDIKFKIMP